MPAAREGAHAAGASKSLAEAERATAVSTPVSVAGQAGIDHQSAVTATDEPNVPRIPRVPRRRRVWLVLLAVLLVVGAAYANYALISARDARVGVLVLAREVGWGQQIADADLAVAQAVADPHAHMVAAADRSRVVGRFATQRLVAGSVLAPEHLSDVLVPGPGQQVVGLLLKPGQLPAMGLRPGDGVEVVPVAPEQAGATAPSTVRAFRARVVDVGRPDVNGAVTVDVEVAREHSDEAAAAAAGRVVVTLLGPGS